MVGVIPRIIMMLARGIPVIVVVIAVAVVTLALASIIASVISARVTAVVFARIAPLVIVARFPRWFWFWFTPSNCIWLNWIEFAHFKTTAFDKGGQCRVYGNRREEEDRGNPHI
jgi:hypothetical protein